MQYSFSIIAEKWSVLTLCCYCLYSLTHRQRPLFQRLGELVQDPHEHDCQLWSRSSVITSLSSEKQSPIANVLSTPFVSRVLCHVLSINPYSVTMTVHEVQSVMTMGPSPTNAGLGRRLSRSAPNGGEVEVLDAEVDVSGRRLGASAAPED